MSTATLPKNYQVIDRRSQADPLVLKNIIPPMTDPMGRHWNQPKASNILIDDTHAVMSKATFEQLAEYSCSMPSGVYPGKMWRRDNAFGGRPCKPEERHMLIWFGRIETDEKGKEYVTNNYRTILILS